MSKTIRVTAVSTAAALLAACATSPDKIDAQYVSDAQYASYNCRQIGEEMRRIGLKVSEVTEEQEEAATADAVGMGVGLILFWPALFILATTDDQEADLARLKGEYEALQRSSTKKNCSPQAMAAASVTAIPADRQVQLRTEASETELAYWKSIEDGDNPEFFKTYLSQYPDGPFVPLAKNRLEELGVPAEEIPAPATQVVAVSPYVNNQGVLIEEGFQALTGDREFKKRLKGFFDSVDVRGGFYSNPAKITAVRKVSLLELRQDSAVYRVKFRTNLALSGKTRESTGKFHVEPEGSGYAITLFIDGKGNKYRKSKE